MNALAFVIVFVIILIFLFKISRIIEWPAVQYNNSVLDLIGSQENWGYYSNGTLVSPYVFKIMGGSIQVSYYDSLGGYLSGIVIFNTSYSILNANNIQLTPTSLVSTATNRWPQIPWTLTYVNSTNLTLNNGTNNISLTTE